MAIFDLPKEPGGYRHCEDGRRDALLCCGEKQAGTGTKGSLIGFSSDAGHFCPDPNRLTETSELTHAITDASMTGTTEALQGIYVAMNPDDFQELYLSELSEMRSTEAQMAESLNVLAERATDPGLSEAIRVHAEETAKHRDLLDDLMTDHGARPDSHSDTSMKTLISEADKWAGMVEDESLRDAGLIASLQRMEHYEMAVLGTLVSWADRLGHTEDAEILSAILYDDKQADAMFSRIAKTAVNPSAVATGPGLATF